MNKKTIANIRTGLSITWILLAVVLLLLIQYAEVNVEAQGFVTVLTWVYIYSAFVVSGVIVWLKRKES